VKPSDGEFVKKHLVSTDQDAESVKQRREILYTRGQCLVELFFWQQDRVLVETLQREEASQQRMQALQQVSGVHNPEVLQRLVELDVSPEVLAAISVLPLVEVAWADGRMDQKGKAAVLAGANPNPRLRQGKCTQPVKRETKRLADGL
jgi:hypothetical protein